MARKQENEGKLTGFIHVPAQTLEELKRETEENDKIRAWAKAHWEQAKKDMPDTPDTLIMAYLTNVYPKYRSPSEIR